MNASFFGLPEGLWDVPFGAAAVAILSEHVSDDQFNSLAHPYGNALIRNIHSAHGVDTARILFIFISFSKSPSYFLILFGLWFIKDNIHIENSKIIS